MLVLSLIVTYLGIQSIKCQKAYLKKSFALESGIEVSLNPNAKPYVCSALGISLQWDTLRRVVLILSYKADLKLEILVEGGSLNWLRSSHEDGDWYLVQLHEKINSQQLHIKYRLINN